MIVRIEANRGDEPETSGAMTKSKTSEMYVNGSRRIDRVSVCEKDEIEEKEEFEDVWIGQKADTRN